MPFASALSVAYDPREAVPAVCSELRSQLGNQQPDLVFLFLTRHHAPAAKEIARDVCERLQARHVLGCTAEAIVGVGREVEEGPGISLWGAILPEAQLRSFHTEFEKTSDGLVCAGWPDSAEDENMPTAAIVLGDPFSCPVDALIDRLADEYPGLPLIGGMASGGRQPGENSLIYNGELVSQGAVGVLLSGGMQVRSVVSQGCRQLGSPFVITRAQQNVIFELGGVPALQRFQELYGELDESDRQLVRQGVHLGIVMNEYQDSFSRGDFLISNVIGVDQESGAIAIGNVVRTGQTVQFHVRDAGTADEDLRQMLEASVVDSAPAQAALLFSCNGRGTRMFPEPHHDASAVQEICGSLPIAGFFAQGELGPVGDKNYIHGYTASMALFGDQAG